MTYSAAEYGYFFSKVYAAVARIPYGRVANYGQIAGLVGMPRNARMVGRALRICPDDLPWHRVVMKDGSVTGGEYAPLRRAMLESEGVPFLPDGRVDMEAAQWRP
ncbi:MAG TPA: MGMT family protein [Candidatus Limnocylindria bacterium]|nr:MGMT family protein [Candidatus Limnocylindria bacterium]